MTCMNPDQLAATRERAAIDRIDALEYALDSAATALHNLGCRTAGGFGPYPFNECTEKRCAENYALLHPGQTRCGRCGVPQLVVKDGICGSCADDLRDDGKDDRAQALYRAGHQGGW